MPIRSKWLPRCSSGTFSATLRPNSSQVWLLKSFGFLFSRPDGVSEEFVVAPSRVFLALHQVRPASTSCSLRGCWRNNCARSHLSICLCRSLVFLPTLGSRDQLAVYSIRAYTILHAPSISFRWIACQQPFLPLALFCSSRCSRNQATMASLTSSVLCKPATARPSRPLHRAQQHVARPNTFRVRAAPTTEKVRVAANRHNS